MKKFRGEEVEDNSGPVSHLRWEADYYLTPMPRNALFYEYLEMGRYTRLISKDDDDDAGPIRDGLLLMNIKEARFKLYLETKF